MGELSCFGCKREFNLTDREPRVLPSCGHTFCAGCIAGWLAGPAPRVVCPEDRRECAVDGRAGLAAFPANIALARLVAERARASPAPQPEERPCAEHAKPADLVCTTDCEAICADCVLFGAHKNHEYLRREDFLRQACLRADRAVDELRLLGRQTFLADGQRKVAEARQALRAKQLELQGRADRHFKALADWLRAQQEAFRGEVEAKTGRLALRLDEFERRLSRLVEREQSAALRLEETRAQLAAPLPDAHRLVQTLYGPADPFADLAELRGLLRAAEKNYAELCTVQVNGLALATDTAPVFEVLTGNLGLELLDRGAGEPLCPKSPDSSFLITNDGNASEERNLETARGEEMPLPPTLLKSAKNAVSSESLPHPSQRRPRRLLSDVKAPEKLNRSVLPSRGTTGQRFTLRSDARALLSESTLPPERVLRFDAKPADELVSFANLRITDAKLFSVVADVLRNKRAKTLVLDNNKVTTAGLETLLRRLAPHDALERLSLVNNLLDDNALPRLAQLAGELRSLRSFCFADNKAMKLAGRARRLRADLLKVGISVEL